MTVAIIQACATAAAAAIAFQMGRGWDETAAMLRRRRRRRHHNAAIRHARKAGRME